MARQSSVGWACGWLVSAAVWSWIEKELWFPRSFSKRKWSARAHSVREHLQHFQSPRSFVRMPYLPSRKVRWPNSICEVCILSEIGRVTSLTGKRPKYFPHLFQVPKPSVTTLQLPTMDQLLWVGTVNRQQQRLVVMKDTRWMEVKYYTVDQMDSGVKTNQLVKVGERKDIENDHCRKEALVNWHASEHADMCSQWLGMIPYCLSCQMEVYGVWG